MVVLQMLLVSTIPKMSCNLILLSVIVRLIWTLFIPTQTNNFYVMFKKIKKCIIQLNIKIQPGTLPNMRAKFHGYKFQKMPHGISYSLVMQICDPSSGGAPIHYVCLGQEPPKTPFAHEFSTQGM